jgi:hypothetical protein
MTSCSLPAVFAYNLKRVMHSLLSDSFAAFCEAGARVKGCVPLCLCRCQFFNCPVLDRAAAQPSVRARS